jgi:phospholipase/carboxylesterase
MTGQALVYDLHLPDTPADGAPLAVLLHGRGSDKTDLAGLRSFLPGEWIVVLPRAPFPGAEWGYGGGWAWYQYLGGNVPEPESFELSLHAVGRMLAALPASLPVKPGPILLGGFSQGGTVSTGYAVAVSSGLLVPEGGTAYPTVPMVANLSGFIAEHPLVRVGPRSVKGMRFFWGHGLHDPAIPFAFAAQGRASLIAAGADLFARDYHTGHWIEPQEMADLVAWAGSAPSAEA